MALKGNYYWRDPFVTATMFTGDTPFTAKSGIPSPMNPPTIPLEISTSEDKDML